jgi:divinyl chlorophyllide a 8-vinyl-reductase
MEQPQHRIEKNMANTKKCVLVVGATGYIGRQVVKELVSRNYQVVAVSRRPAKQGEFEGAEVRIADVTDPQSLKKLFHDDINVVISCMACKRGMPADFDKIDYQATLNVLEAAQANITDHFILLSAICVKVPKLPLQYAKLKMENALMISGMDYTIVRPTAYFWTMDRQFDNIRKGRAGWIFGSGELTRYNPISKEDLAEFMINCVEDTHHRNRLYIIGGPETPENVVTNKRNIEMIFEALGEKPNIRSVPYWLLSTAIGMTKFIALFIPKVRQITEILRIFHYYSTNDMLAPGYGTRTIKGHLDMLAKE